MGFGDLKSRDGQQNLNNFLADKSYIEGYQPSQADSVVYGALSGAPPKDLCHVFRWYNHVSSYSKDEQSKFPGQKKDVNSYGPGASSAGGKAADDDDDDDDFDLFGSDDDDDAEAAEQLKQKRLEEYAAKKAKKPAVVAKSSIVLYVKPWDDETDMKEMERLVRSIEQDGLLWGKAQLVPVGYGINKLQIGCVVEDLKVSVDDLCEKIQEYEDLVQSVDIAAFNKI